MQIYIHTCRAKKNKKQKTVKGCGGVLNQEHMTEAGSVCTVGLHMMLHVCVRIEDRQIKSQTQREVIS